MRIGCQRAVNVVRSRPANVTAKTPPSKATRPKNSATRHHDPEPSNPNITRYTEL